MCQLATVYCDHMLKAMIGGEIRNLRDEPHGHHAFVYGLTDKFPEHVAKYLVEAKVPGAELYRERAVDARRENLTRYRLNGFMVDNGRPEEVRFARGESATLSRDPFATDEEWGRMLRLICDQRGRALIEAKLKSKQPPYLTDAEKCYYKTVAPHQWAEYEAAVNDLSRPITGRTKHVARKWHAARDRVKAKGKALARMLKQKRYAEYVVAVTTPAEIRIAA